MQFHIENMTCGGCAKSVAKVVAMLDPAARLEANVPDRTVEIQTTATAEAVKQRLQEAGWQVRTPE